MRDNASPEGRLLALIKKARPRKADDKTADGRTASEKTDTAGAIRSFFKGALSSPDILKHINKYLVFVVAIFTAYLLFDIIFIKPEKKIVLLTSRKIEPVSDLGYKGEDIKPQPKDFSQYSSQISARKIFAPPAVQETQAQQTGRPAEEIFGNLNLVGIIAGDDPQAIIEDKKSQKTYYLNKDQSFDGITVEDISEDKVMLNSGGRRTTLVL